MANFKDERLLWAVSSVIKQAIEGSARWIFKKGSHIIPSSMILKNKGI